MQEVPAPLEELDGGTGGAEEEDGEPEVAGMDAHTEGGDAQEQLRQLEKEVDALGGEDVGDEGEGVGVEQQHEPGDDAADVVAGAYPFVAEEEGEEGLGIEECHRHEGEDYGVEAADEAQGVAPEGLALAHLVAVGGVEDFLEGVGEDADGAHGEGEGEAEEADEGVVEVDAEPKEGEVGGEAADQLLGHGVEGEVFVS